MKSFPSTILIDIEKNNKNFNPILFYGNEGGLILGLIKSIFNIFKNEIEIDEIKYFDHKSDNHKEFEQILKSPSLFSKINFIVIKNPQERLIIELENIEKTNNVLIINGEGLRSNSKLKSYFDNHNNFISVPCYKLNRIDIKRIAGNFIRKNNIGLHGEAYEFLIDNVSEDYLVLENELQKLSAYTNLSINLKSLQRLIVQKNNINVDNYFFNCAVGNSKLILKEINSSNLSISESYEILISLKKFINILSNAVVNKNNYSLDGLVKTYLPKYLFLKKDIFKNILIKINLIKLTKINTLLQKTEYLFRKNSEQHREILERFLLNLVKIMK